MTERDRLISILQAKTQPWEYLLCKSNIEALADYLLKIGVIMLPCKVGDTIYFDTYKRGESIGIQPHKVANISIVVSTERPFGYVGADIYDWEFGKTVFLTREEAEKALKERERNER